jgi:hypothetical protein
VGGVVRAQQGRRAKVEQGQECVGGVEQRHTVVGRRAQPNCEGTEIRSDSVWQSQPKYVNISANYLFLDLTLLSRFLLSASVVSICRKSSNHPTKSSELPDYVISLSHSRPPDHVGGFRLTNVAIVRLKKGGKRFEVCSPTFCNIQIEIQCF